MRCRSIDLTREQHDGSLVIGSGSDRRKSVLLVNRDNPDAEAVKKLG